MSPTTSDSDIIFESQEVKRDYALVLTNWVIENYNVENDVAKRQIFEELFILPDVNLLEKWKMIEEFLDIRIIDSQKLLRTAQSLSNTIAETEEKIGVAENVSFNF